MSDIKIKDTITEQDFANIIEKIAGFVIRRETNDDGEFIIYQPYFMNRAEIIAIGSTIVEGVDLETGDDVLVEYAQNEDFRAAIALFFDNYNDEMAFIRTHAKDIIDFRKSRI